jgi:chromosome segregation ATPase
MQTRRQLAANQPALIPIAGHCDRKPRPLDRDVTTIGRARGSDLCLEANEISTLHCVIYRSAEGYRIRDCNSRWGTKINGESVKTALLHDGAIVNLGPFSFEFRLPPALFPNDARVDPLKVEHWKASRRRLVELALRLRRRAQSGSPREQEWAQKGHLLKDKIRCYDQRLSELEGAEEELADERRQLAAEAERHRQHVQTVEHQLAERLAQADEEIHQRWQDFQKRCQVEEARRGGDKAGEPRNADDNNKLARDLEEQYTRRFEQLQREQQEFSTMKEQWVQDQQKSAVDLEAQHAALAQKRADLVRMMGDLKQMQEDLRKQARPDVRALHDEIERLKKENAASRSPAADADLAAILDENEQLRVRVAQLESAPAGHQGSGARQLDDLLAEIELLREEVERKDKVLSDLSSHGGGDAGPVRAENVILKQLLDERNRVIAELTDKVKHKPKNETDLERYEAELNDFRRQLENDRAKLNTEVETLRDRNKELDEAIREMEMEMSKERAELARERMRLERVREEIKGDTERLQRELAVRDSMAPVQKLRDELTGKEKPLNDRLRGIRNQLTDSHPAGS